MNKRELLKLFGFATAALALPASFAEDENLETAENLTDYIRPPYTGLPYVEAFRANGIGTSSGVVAVGLRRAKQQPDIMRYYINRYGGCLLWSPPAGGKIFVPASHPVEVFCEGDDVEVHAAIRLIGQDQFQVLSISGRGEMVSSFCS